MKPRREPEYALQCVIVQMLRLNCADDVIWFAIPNGTYTSKRTAGRLKAAGVVAGVADLEIIIRGRAHFLELKSPVGRQSPAQWEFELACIASGTPYAIARSPEDAANILSAWGAIKSNPLRLTPAVAREAA